MVKKALTSANKIDAHTADQKPDTENPGTNQAVSININPLITNVKSPRLRRLIGSVNKMTTGLITAFTIPNTPAAINTAKGPVTLSPGTSADVTNKASELTAHRYKRRGVSSGQLTIKATFLLHPF